MSNLAQRRKELAQRSWSEGYFPRGQWEFSSNTTGEPSVVAKFQTERAVWLREDRDMQMVVPAYDQITSNGAGTSDTYSLSANIFDSPATDSLVLYADGNVVQPDSIDYANDTFDYTDDGTTQELDAYYVPRDPATATFKKKAPGASAALAQNLFTKATSIMHTRDQHKDPVEFDLNKSVLQPFVPRKWEIVVEVDAPYTVKYEEDTRNTSATNALLSVPRHQSDQRIPGLKEIVKADIAGVA